MPVTPADGQAGCTGVMMPTNGDNYAHTPNALRVLVANIRLADDRLTVRPWAVLGTARSASQKVGKQRHCASPAVGQERVSSTRFGM